MHRTIDVEASMAVPVAARQKVVMLVDDDPIFRRITHGFLEAQGYQVIEAENGLDGLSKLRFGGPDLILCDLAMPILNGIEFVEEVSHQYPSLPLIVVSATVEISDVAKALRFGIKDFLAKPITNYQHLACAIKTTLDDSDNYLCQQRDFSSQWFRVESGDMPEEQELHWHLEYLEDNPNAAKDLLHALLPDRDTSQGDWKCSYRLLQSTDTMPMVFDYAWLINGQFVFYLVDPQCDAKHGAATALLVRALFHDYLRNLKCFNADLKDIAALIEKGIQYSACSTPLKALFGVADLSAGSLSILPAGLESQWSNGYFSQPIPAGMMLGDKCGKNFITSDLPIQSACQLTLNRLGSSSFSLDIYRGAQHHNS